MKACPDVGQARTATRRYLKEKRDGSRRDLTSSSLTMWCEACVHPKSSVALRSFARIGGLKGFGLWLEIYKKGSLGL